METYCVGAYNFAKESITALKEGGGGTLIFTGLSSSLPVHVALTASEQALWARAYYL